MNEEKLIFIISQPRSGSTYLQNLLSNNTRVNTTSEPWLLLNFVSIIKPDIYKAQFDEELTQMAIEEYSKSLPNNYLNKTFKKFILDLYEPLAKGFDFFIDKTPRYWEVADELVTLFPNAKVVVIVRNPIDVVNSIIRTWDLNSLNELNRFKRDLIIAPSKLLEFVKRNKDNPNVRSLRYEDLASNTRQETKALYEWLEIPFTDQVLQTELNSKFKGAFGDPYQNSNLDYVKEKHRSKTKAINNKLKEFLQGYAYYLNVDYLNYFGYSKDIYKARKTKAFSYYMTLKTNYNNDPNESFKRILLRKLLSYFYS